MSLQTKTGKFQFRLQVTGCNKHMSHIRQHTPTAHRIHTDETWMTPRSWFTVHSQDNKPQTHLSTHQISRKQSHTQPSCAAAAFTTIRHWNVSRRDRCINWVLVFDLQGNVLTHSNALKSFGTEMCTANHWLTCCTNYQNRLRCAEVIDINFLPRFCGLVVGMSKGFTSTVAGAWKCEITNISYSEKVHHHSWYPAEYWWHCPWTGININSYRVWQNTNDVSW